MNSRSIHPLRVILLCLTSILNICHAQNAPRDPTNLVKLIEERKWQEALKELDLMDKDNPNYSIYLVRLKILTDEFEEAFQIMDQLGEKFTDDWSYYALGTWFIDKSPNRSRELLGRSLELNPSPRTTSSIIFLAQALNDMPLAVQSLHSLFKRHPNLMGGYSEKLGLPINNDEIDFAKRQVNQMLEDRPQLRDFIGNNSRLKAWLINRFSGQYIGSRVYWSSTSFDGIDIETNAAHLPASQSSDCKVWVKPSLKGELQFAGIVYELLNAENSSETCIQVGLAQNGLGKKEFVREIAKLEHRALIKRRAFFVVEYLAGSLPKDCTFAAWDLDVPDDFDEYVKSLSTLTLQHYEATFDSILNYSKKGWTFQTETRK